MRFDLDHALAVLSRTPSLVRTLVADLPAEWTERDEGAETWSAKEVVAHLVFGERTDWIPRLRILLRDGEARPFDPFDQRGHASLMREHDVAGLVELFARERAESLDTLRAVRLTAADLERRGTHPTFGPVTLGNLLATWVVHDLNHIGQICRAECHQYREAVGPWVAFLGILDRT